MAGSASNGVWRNGRRVMAWLAGKFWQFVSAELARGAWLAWRVAVGDGLQPALV
jgi:hypothetical protein